MELDTQVKLAIYRHFAETGMRPELEIVAERVGVTPEETLAAYGRLCDQRVLVVEEDGSSIRMASPFSGVPTQHVVDAGGILYHANCAWDALGVCAALRRPAVVRSRCEQSLEPLLLEVGTDGPGPSDWLFHSLVPTAHWWDDVVFT